jgi:hypothetical protein
MTETVLVTGGTGFAGGVHVLWPSGMTYMEALPGRMGGKA